MFEVNNFTAIASRIIPKTFRIMLMPDLPKNSEYILMILKLYKQK